MTKAILTQGIDKTYIKNEVTKKLKRGLGVSPEEASKEDIYKAVSLTVRDIIMERWADANEQVWKQRAKRLYYLSAEFLMGRALVNNMINLHLAPEYREALSELGLSLSDIEEQEPDPGLGNGGLGRLAACFLDALSTLDLPVTGCCIRYEHGLFRQRIENGEQREDDDNWLENGNVWEVERPNDTVEVRYGGGISEVWTDAGLRIEHSGYTAVSAVPYDMPVIGYESAMPATLRMWSARAKTEIDMEHFNRGDYVAAASESALVESISQVLYPEDNHEQGRLLRLKQFYFFTSASMQFLVNKHKEHYGDLRTLPAHYCVQINDTHPTLAIPELIRILIDDEEMQWDEAFEIASQMFNYTNHTIMREALERWNEEMLKSLLPRVYRIITEIDKKFRDRIWAEWPGDVARLHEMAIIDSGEIRMANLCIAVCSRVNGVSQLHGEIIRTRTFRDFYILYPDKFLGITNGITHRRWLAKSNEGLTALIADRIGEGFLLDWREMDRVKEFVSDEGFLEAFSAVKRANKLRLRDHLYRTHGIEINADTSFDVQAKRLHEYKRQLLKIMHVLHLYFEVKSGNRGVAPATFLFAAKAAPGYHMAKEIIRLILSVGELVNQDPSTRDILKVVFIENYSVSEAEILIPATDVSEQLSTAGLEASGTGNMKFMLNGAVTIGTLDGANVEIAEAVGRDNIFIFGADAYEIARMETAGDYAPRRIYESDARIRRVIDCFTDGTLPVQNGRQFEDITNALLNWGGGKADQYFLLHDFASYADVYGRMMGVFAGLGAVEEMAAREARGEIAAREAQDEIAAREARDEIAAREARDEIAAREARDEIAARDAQDEIAAREARGEIAAREARDEIAAREARDEIAAREARDVIEVQDESEARGVQDARGARGVQARGGALNGYTREWMRLVAANTAAAGCFFADRTIQEYNDKVWHLGAVEFPAAGGDAAFGAGGFPAASGGTLSGEAVFSAAGSDSLSGDVVSPAAGGDAASGALAHDVDEGSGI
ncbi:MAG: glycogen/starch/alpha-glucan family phosphorylase [Clostridiales Family XIII bacterium]|jgi:starch phosphorylase|nr:glycogen/starch/alpha-glucan family phosphorylase [Clostridiales Family XIII bacterium]